MIGVVLAGTAHPFPLLALESEQPPPATFLFSSGIDLWRLGGSAYGAAQWSPGGVDREGLTFKLLTSKGLYRYRSGGVDVTGAHTIISAMPGWKFRKAGIDVTLYAGVDWQSHRFAPDDLGNPARGSRVGLRAAADVWLEPAKDWMVAGSVSASTVARSYWLRAATGWRLMDRWWTGPEIQVSGEERYRQARAGVHVSGLRAGMFEWSAGGGVASDSERRTGGYGWLGMLVRP
jgi:hypothetical protein